MPVAKAQKLAVTSHQPPLKISVTYRYLRQVDGDPIQYLQTSRYPKHVFGTHEFQETAVFLMIYWYIFGSFSGSVMFRKKDPVVSLSILKPFFRVSGEFQSGHILKKK